MKKYGKSRDARLHVDDIDDEGQHRKFTAADRARVMDEAVRESADSMDVRIEDMT